MAHTLRLFAPDNVYHVTQRGNNRMPVFRMPQDRHVYLQYMSESLGRRTCRLYAYCLMTNHVHLLVSASDPEDVSRLMEEVQGRYARYFNLNWHRAGSLWQRRFRATPVVADAHMIGCFLYLDMNPIRGRLVERPEQYYWSSYRSLAFGEPSAVLSHHPCYLDLGSTDKERGQQYHERMRVFLEEWRTMSGYD